MSRKPSSFIGPNKVSRQYDGLVSWWPFALKQGVTVYETERGNTGAIVGSGGGGGGPGGGGPGGGGPGGPGGDPNTLYVTDGERGQHVLNFDGFGYVFLGDLEFVDEIGLTGELTWSVWTRIDSTASTQYVINKQGPSESAGFGLQWDSANGWTFQIDTNTGYTGTSGYTADTWYHIAVVYNGGLSGDANRLKIYINGVNQSLTFSGSVPATITNTPTELLFGGRNTPGSFMNGAIDDIRLYNRPLTNSEVVQLWNPQTRWELYQQKQLAFPEGFAFTNEITGSGGVVVGGTADQTLFDYTDSTGGVVGGGGTVESVYTANIDTTGGVVVGGSTLFINNVDTTGGIVVGGTAEQIFIDYVDGSGGVVVGGNSDTSYFNSIDGTGGVIVGGSAEEILSDIIYATGGVVTGGDSENATFNYIDSTGGVVVNGSADVSGAGEATTVGGIIVGGNPTIAFIYNIVTTGGVVTGGTSIFVESLDTTGGVVVAGDPTINFTYNLSATGGVVTGGQHEQTFIDYIDGTGGTVTGGHAPLEFDLDTTGGAVCGGSSFPYADTIDETGQGGVVCGGSANVTDDKVYILVDCPEGYYVCAPKNEDAYCLRFIDFISYGSPVFKELSRNTAKMPPIILCRQRINKDEEGFEIGAKDNVIEPGSPIGVRSESEETAEEERLSFFEFDLVSTVGVAFLEKQKIRASGNLNLSNFSPVKTNNKIEKTEIVVQEDRPISNLQAKANFVRETKSFTKTVKSNKAKTQTGNIAKNTPQMAKLRKANELIRHKKSVPEELRTFSYKGSAQPKPAPSKADKPIIRQDAL